MAKPLYMLKNLQITTELSRLSIVRHRIPIDETDLFDVLGARGRQCAHRDDLRRSAAENHASRRNALAVSTEERMEKIRQRAR